MSHFVGDTLKFVTLLVFIALHASKVVKQHIVSSSVCPQNNFKNYGIEIDVTWQKCVIMAEMCYNALRSD